MPDLQLATIDVKAGAAMESQSGLQMLRPRIYGAWLQPPGPKRAAAIVMHPTSNFMGHYLVAPLAQRGTKPRPRSLQRTPCAGGNHASAHWRGLGERG